MPKKDIGKTGKNIKGEIGKSNLLGIKELQEQFLRMSADFDNYRKRVEKEKIEMRKYAKIEIFEKLLPLLENFERAISCAPENDWSRGVCQLFGSLEEELKKIGLKKFNALGEKFDSSKHEALLTEENSAKKDIVIEELQSGWMIGETVIRPAKVRVGV